MVAKLEGIVKAAETAFYMEYDWIPNRGLVFTDDNPYTQMNNNEILDEYQGGFRTEGGEEMILKLNKNNKELNLVLNNKNYPVFYLEKDRFLTSHASHFLTFKRDDKNNIIGLESTHTKDVLKKLTE